MYLCDRVLPSAVFNDVILCRCLCKLLCGRCTQPLKNSHSRDAATYCIRCNHQGSPTKIVPVHTRQSHDMIHNSILLLSKRKILKAVLSNLHENQVSTLDLFKGEKTCSRAANVLVWSCDSRSTSRMVSTLFHDIKNIRRRYEMRKYTPPRALSRETSLDRAMDAKALLSSFHEFAHLGISVSSRALPFAAATCRSSSRTALTLSGNADGSTSLSNE